jgi:hypothetical protein
VQISTTPAGRRLKAKATRVTAEIAASLGPLGDEDFVARLRRLEIALRSS